MYAKSPSSGRFEIRDLGKRDFERSNQDPEEHTTTLFVPFSGLQKSGTKTQGMYDAARLACGTAGLECEKGGRLTLVSSSARDYARRQVQ